MNKSATSSERVWSPVHFCFVGFKRDLYIYVSIDALGPVEDLIFYHRKWKKWRYQVETQYAMIIIPIYIHILYVYIYIHESRWCIVTSSKGKRKGPKRINSTNLKSLLRLDAVLSSESANRWGRLNAVDGCKWIGKVFIVVRCVYR